MIRYKRYKRKVRTQKQIKNKGAKSRDSPEPRNDVEAAYADGYMETYTKERKKKEGQ